MIACPRAKPEGRCLTILWVSRGQMPLSEPHPIILSSSIALPTLTPRRAAATEKGRLVRPFVHSHGESGSPMPEVLDWQCVADPRAIVRYVAAALHAGQVVAFPTDTAYALPASPRAPA